MCVEGDKKAGHPLHLNVPSGGAMPFNEGK